MGFSHKIRSFNHPVAIERWRAYLTHKDYSMNDGSLVFMAVIFSCLGYLYAVRGYSIFYLLMCYVLGEAVFFLSWYSKNVEPEVDMREVLDQ